MKFLKETLKKLRWKLLVKVLEKQDELSIKAQDLANQTSVKLQETASAAAEKTIASLAQSAVEIRQAAEAGTEKAVASIATAKTEILSSIDKATATSVNSQDELSIKVQDLANQTSAKLQETASAAAEKTIAEIRSAMDKAVAASVNRQDELSIKVQDSTNLTLAKLQETAEAGKTIAEMRSTIKKAAAETAKKQDIAELKTELKVLLATDAEKVEPVSLKAEKGLLNYLRLLKGLSKRYMIIIAVRDTPGACLTDEIATGIKALGLSADLSFEKGMKRQYHRTYIGVIDRGQVVCETLSKQKEPSYYTAMRDGVSYEVVSKAYIGNVAEIRIDGVDYATNGRVLNIVVFDPTARTVIDSVCFDTHVPAFTCSRLEEVVDKLLRNMNVLTLSGYTVPQYCIDNKITSVVIYSEPEYWSIAENICLSFSFNPKVDVRTYCASRPFRRTPLDNDGVFMNLNFVNINDAQLDSGDTVLVLHLNPQTEILKRFETSGLHVVTLWQIVREMNEYIIGGIRTLMDYSVKHPDISIVCYNPPVFPTKNLSICEQELKEKGLFGGKVIKALSNGQLVTHAFDDFHYTDKELLELCCGTDRVYNPNGELVFKDKKGLLVNFVNGRRITTDQPSRRKRSIFGLGKCYGAGLFTPDDKTIWSYLQRRFNEDTAEFGVVVENYTVQYVGNFNDGYKKLWYIPVKPNDIIITDIWAPKYFPAIDLSGLFQRPHNYGEVFVSLGVHYNENGYCAIADALFKFLQEHDFFENSLPPPPEDPSLPVVTPPPMFGILQDRITTVAAHPQTPYAKELATYKAFLKQTSETAIGRIGAVVMNCNPFTLGHRWLVEYAAQQVKRLYLFAVEEDKSVFPFADRFELIKQGVADLSNVTVLPSGKFIISSLTFTDYFSKSEMQDRVIDPTQDVRLFAEEIAPVLNITVRFAGEEPLDNVTRQYNEAMRRILPEYGIAFEEIERKEADGGVVSASRVRALLDAGAFEDVAGQLERLVPRTTLEYLERRAKQQTKA